MMSKTRNAPIVRSATATRITGRSSGSVMRLNFCQRVAPSTSAASYRSAEIGCKPASSNSVIVGTVFQASARMITFIVQNVSLSQALGACNTPRPTSSALATP